MAYVNEKKNFILFLLLVKSVVAGTGGLSQDALFSWSYLPYTSTDPSYHRTAGEVSVEEAITKLRFAGSAQVLDDGIGTVRLTEDKQSQSGRVSFSEPSSLQGTVFQADITMRLSGNGVSLAGDGMAVWYTETPLALINDEYNGGGYYLGGPMGAWKGMAIFIDTYNNNPMRDTHPHPYISLMLNDGTLLVDHNGEQTHSSLHEPVGCSAQVREVTNHGRTRILTLRVTYNQHQKVIRGNYFVGDTLLEHLDPDHQSGWTPCFEATNIGIDLFPGYFWGFSASTGDLTDAHDLLRFSLTGEDGAVIDDVPIEIRSRWDSFSVSLKALERPFELTNHGGRILESGEGHAGNGEGERGEGSSGSGDGSGSHESSGGEQEGGGGGGDHSGDDPGSPPHEHQEEDKQAHLEIHQEQQQEHTEQQPEFQQSSSQPPLEQGSSHNSPPPPSSSSTQFQPAHPSPPPPTIIITKAEINRDELNELMRQSAASQHLHGRIDDASRSISESRTELSRKEDELTRDVRELVARLRSAEVEFESRLSEVEARFATKYEKLLAENLANGRSWVTPVSVLGAVALALGLFNGLNYYKASRKSRLD
jgi:hypothetical protein